MAFMFFFAIGSSVVWGDSEEIPDDLFNLSIEELMQVEVSSSASLTEARPQLAPAAVTTISEEQIQASGARSLFELLDIYVPNLQWIRRHWESDGMGLRGIMGDRDDKYLLLVNGRMMNERTHYGALTERDLVLLRDIHHIDVVRGPGSAMYGPGAVAMVINIITHSAETFEGTDITTRMGAIEEFYSAEIRHGHKFADNDGGLFSCFGIGNYMGADGHDAPQHYGFDFPSVSVPDWWNPAWGSPFWPNPPNPVMPADGLQAGYPLTHSTAVPRDGEAARNLPPLKVHVQVDTGNWTFWGRYTRGGKQIPWEAGQLAREPFGWGDWIALPLENQFWAYQQATLFAGHKLDIGDRSSLETSLSYDMTDNELFTQNTVANAYREDKYYFKSILRHHLNDQHKMALGFELMHHELGFQSPGWPGLDDPVNQRFTADNEGAAIQIPFSRWSTNMYSILGEYQWNFNDQWTTFLGARVDDHTFTEPMFSPRTALIYTPTDQDTLKMIWSRSVRANFEEEMKAQSLRTGDNSSEPEVMDSVEFRYERAHTKNLDMAMTVFLHYNLELMGYSGKSTKNIGTQKDWGFEVEARYHTDTTEITFSHGFTKLIDFELAENVNDTSLTAHPNGYGNDLARWTNNITKLTARHHLSDTLTLDGSLRIYWGFPGLEDLDDYRRENARYQHYTAGWERSYRGSYLLNLGLQYEPSDNLTLRLDGYNLLGIFNKDFNKRIYGEGDFRSHAPAIGLSMTHRF